MPYGLLYIFVYLHPVAYNRSANAILFPKRNDVVEQDLPSSLFRLQDLLPWGEKETQKGVFLPWKHSTAHSDLKKKSLDATENCYFKNIVCIQYSRVVSD